MVSPGHEGHLPQVWGQSKLPSTHAIRVSSPLLVVRGGIISLSAEISSPVRVGSSSLSTVSSERTGLLSLGQ